MSEAPAASTHKPPRQAPACSVSPATPQGAWRSPAGRRGGRPKYAGASDRQGGLVPRGLGEERPPRKRPVNPSRPTSTAVVGAYLSAAQLAAVTPWSVQSIEKMVRRGTLQRGIHWFQPFGPRTQLVFKWSALVELIEGENKMDAGDTRPVVKGNVLDVEKATAEFGRLLGR